MNDWVAVYLGWLLFAITGFMVGYRACWYVHRYQRRRLVARWRMERRKHRQKNPWVKAWVCIQYFSGHQGTKAEYGRMINRKVKRHEQNTIPNQPQQDHAGAD